MARFGRWSPSDHPRYPKGHPLAGQFMEDGGGRKFQLNPRTRKGGFKDNGAGNHTHFHADKTSTSHRHAGGGTPHKHRAGQVGSHTANPLSMARPGVPAVRERPLPKGPAVEGREPGEPALSELGSEEDLEVAGAIADVPPLRLPRPKRRKESARNPAAGDDVDQEVARGMLPVGAGGGMRAGTEEDRKRLKIPPAARDLQVTDDPTAPLQARYRDAKGRPKYVHTDEHHRQAAQAKFERVAALHQVIPKLDEALARDAEGDDTAAATLLIRRMGLRPGSTTDTKADVQAYGATTLQGRHVLVDDDGRVRLDFIGKEGKHLTFDVEDEDLAAVLRARKEAAEDESDVFPGTNETKVLAYVKRVTGDQAFKTKDLRTYLANAEALRAMRELTPPEPESLAEFRSARLRVAERVSARLGNTPTMALKAYINPTVFSSWAVDPSWVAA